MKVCVKCGMINHGEITEISACPSCGVIYAKVDAQKKRTIQKTHNEKEQKLETYTVGEKKNSILTKSLSWIFGLLAFLKGIALFLFSPLSALCYIAVSFLLLPPLRKLGHKKTNILIPTWCRGVAIVLLLIASDNALQWSVEAEKKELLAQQAEQKRAKDILTKSHFESNKVEIISSIKSLYESKAHVQSILLAKKYLVSEDDDLINLYNQVKEDYSRIKKVRQEELLKIKQMDLSELVDNYGMGEILLDGTNRYRWTGYYPTGNFTIIRNKKTNTTQEAIDGKMSPQALNNREAARQNKIKAAFSQSDGSHINLTRYIKDKMNDPSSYDHIGTKYWDKYYHLRVLTKYRGKNAFGAIVKGRTIAKVSIDGKVLEIIE